MPVGSASYYNANSFTQIITGDAGWLNEHGAQTAGGPYAEVGNALQPMWNTRPLQYTNFGFTLPSTAQVLGFQVDISFANYFSNTNADYATYLVGLEAYGATANRAQGGYYYGTSSFSYRSYGNLLDNWGATKIIPAAAVNSSSFGVRYVARNYNPSQSDFMWVDHIRMSVAWIARSPVYMHI